MEEINIRSYIKEMVSRLAKHLDVKETYWCFCGSGRKYQECCFQKSADEVIFLEDIFTQLTKYRDSQG
jgi:hypothetical protein